MVYPTEVVSYPIELLGLVNVGAMLVAALVLAYMAIQVRKLEYRVLFALLILFSLTHAEYHLVLSSGQSLLAQRLLYPLSIWILLVFGVYYLRRELKAGG